MGQSRASPAALGLGIVLAVPNPWSWEEGIEPGLPQIWVRGCPSSHSRAPVLTPGPLGSLPTPQQPFGVGQSCASSAHECRRSRGEGVDPGVPQLWRELHKTAAPGFSTLSVAPAVLIHGLGPADPAGNAEPSAGNVPRCHGAAEGTQGRPNFLGSRTLPAAGGARGAFPSRQHPLLAAASRASRSSGMQGIHPGPPARRSAGAG